MSVNQKLTLVGAAYTFLGLALEAKLADVVSGAMPGLLKGCVAAVAVGNRAPIVAAVGTDDAGAALTPETWFPVASVTKLATALAIHRLVELGKIDISVELIEYLPEAGAGHASGVTISRLLTHTSGISEIVNWEKGQPWDALAARWLRVPASTPGKAWTYSDAGYNLIGLVVERVYRKPWHQALTELVLRPLRMEATIGGPSA